jgi:hypothetical protein
MAQFRPCTRHTEGHHARHQADPRPVRGRVRRALRRADSQGCRSTADRPAGDALRRGAWQGGRRHDRPDGAGYRVPLPRRLREHRGATCRRRPAAPRVALGRRDQPRLQPLACRHLRRRAPAGGNAAWCGDIAFSSCGSGDVPAATATTGTTSSSSARPSARPRPCACRPTSCTTRTGLRLRHPAASYRCQPVLRADHRWPGPVLGRRRHGSG